ncbi:MAG: cobalamin-binding protein [Gammaproteobacteria bacterium]|nr:cobalamin-binding protein [Gammaproteobacteria bacterium]
MHSAFFAFLLIPAAVPAAPAVVDDAGRTVSLDQPAARIVSLAPHATELLFSAGAGAKLVGAVEWSDFPEAAAHLPRVGDTHSLDLERIVALQPDLVVAWLSGNGHATIERLEQLGLTVFVSEPATLERIGTSIRDLGALAGTEARALAAAAAFHGRLAGLRERHAGRPVVTVFYQLWHQPMFTVNGRHLISAIMEICGGRNIFADQAALSPQVGVEAVLWADPDVIIASAAGPERPDWLDDWRRWPAMQAVRAERLYWIAPDLLQRHTARILDGAERMCEMLERNR